MWPPRPRKFFRSAHAEYSAHTPHNSQAVTGRNDSIALPGIVRMAFFENNFFGPPRRFNNVRHPPGRLALGDRRVNPYRPWPPSPPPVNNQPLPAPRRHRRRPGRTREYLNRADHAVNHAEAWIRNKVKRIAQGAAVKRQPFKQWPRHLPPELIGQIQSLMNTARRSTPRRLASRRRCYWKRMPNGRRRKICPRRKRTNRRGRRRT